MGRRWIVYGICCLWAGSLAAETASLPSEWRTIARRLGAESFAERQAAEQSLLNHPDSKSLPWLTQIMQGEDREASLRAGRILDRWLATAPVEISEQVEDSMDELAWTKDAATSRMARDSLAVHYELRSRRALAALTEMGAKIDYAPHRRELNEWYNVRHAVVDDRIRHEEVNRMIMQPLASDLDGGVDVDLLDAPDDLPPALDQRQFLPRRPGQIFFTRKWTGGAEGVRQLRRIAHPDDEISVSVVKGASASLLDVQAATAEFDKLQITERGPSLGVSQSMIGFGREGCHVDEVLAGGAAALAGLQPGDQIVSVEDEPVSNFSELVNEIAKYDVGGGVHIQVLRERDNAIFHPLFGRISPSEQKFFTVQLGDWTDVDTESRLWNPQPYLR
ncbi:MAG: PDZ domain-containing protein [Planctomycetaceae bacterium]